METDADVTASVGAASGAITSQASAVVFAVAGGDRLAAKTAVPVILSFTTNLALPSGGTITLTYPSYFFAPFIIPTVAAGGSNVSGLAAACSATSIAAVVVTISGASISSLSSFQITINGFTMGNSGANVADGIIVQTSTDTTPSTGINSGPMTCPAGSYWTGQPPTCSPCPSGTYQNSTDASACTPCDPGKYCGGTVPQQRLSSLDLGIIIVSCALVDLISAFVMFRRVAKEPKSRYKHVLWTILALAIGPLVWVVWYCRQRVRGQSAESYDELAELPGTGTAIEISHPSAVDCLMLSDIASCLLDAFRHRILPA